MEPTSSAAADAKDENDKMLQKIPKNQQKPSFIMNLIAPENPSTYSGIDAVPSPIDRRLTEGRSFNDGNWTSAELKLLHDGIIRYGTKPNALNYIAKTLLRTRSETELKVKVFEIRDLIAEHKEICRDYFTENWLKTGHRNIRTDPDFPVHENLTWAKAIEIIQADHHNGINKYRNPVREAIEQTFSDGATLAPIAENEKVTDTKTARSSPSVTQEVSWPNIYSFIQACTEVRSELPVLNELEASIVARVLDSIEDEASTINDKDKTILRGMLSNIEINSLQGFEPDFPCDPANAVHILVDPLRTRYYGVPEVAAEPTGEEAPLAKKPRSAVPSNVPSTSQ